MKKTRIAITGMGAVTAAGVGVDKLWHAARDGKSAVGPLEVTRPYNNRVPYAAQVRGFDPKALIKDVNPGHIDRFTQFALVAAEEAFNASGITKEELAGPKTASIIGTGIGGIGTVDEGLYHIYVNHGRVDPLTIPRLMANAAAANIGLRYSINGPTFAVSSACSSAAQAIGVGMAMIRSGLVDRAIVGGAEALIWPGPFRVWEAMRVMTPNLCRPFSKDRNGMVLGEGAAIFIIERMDFAKARKAPILCELAGYGTSSDAKDMIRPDLEGTSSAMRYAIEDADIALDDIGYVNAHGTGTVLNDQTESAAIRRIFGERGGTIPVSSTKPIHGHGLGAAGGIELAVTIKAMLENYVPPTINWNEADPACDIDPVANVGRPTKLIAAMSNSFAFGGINASLVIKTL